MNKEDRLTALIVSVMLLLTIVPVLGGGQSDHIGHNMTLNKNKT